MHWSRNLLANIRWNTGCQLLVAASVVTYNPHFLYVSSPYLLSFRCAPGQLWWPPVPALLIIDSFAPHLRGPVLEQAITHHPGVLDLKQHTCSPDEPILAKLRMIACLQAEIPKKSMVLHKVVCWETAAWEVEPSRFITQLWSCVM